MCKYCDDSFIDLWGNRPNNGDYIDAIITEDGYLIIESSDDCGYNEISWTKKGKRFASKSEFIKYNGGITNIIDCGIHVVHLSYCPYCGRKF